MVAPPLGDRKFDREQPPGAPLRSGGPCRKWSDRRRDGSNPPPHYPWGWHTKQRNLNPTESTAEETKRPRSDIDGPGSSVAGCVRRRDTWVSLACQSSGHVARDGNHGVPMFKSAGGHWTTKSPDRVICGGFGCQTLIGDGLLLADRTPGKPPPATFGGNGLSRRVARVEHGHRRHIPDVHIVALHGELDIVSAYDFALALVDVAGSTVVVDLSDLTFIDSTGISALVMARNHVEPTDWASWY